MVPTHDEAEIFVWADELHQAGDAANFLDKHQRRWLVREVRRLARGYAREGDGPDAITRRITDRLAANRDGDDVCGSILGLIALAVLEAFVRWIVQRLLNRLSGGGPMRSLLTLILCAGLAATSLSATAAPLSGTIAPHGSLTSRGRSNPATTNVGAWQAKKFAADKMCSIGCWELVSDADNMVASRRVRRINPDAPTSMDPGWNATYERWRRVYPNWRSRFDPAAGDIPVVIDWLCPNWLNLTPPATTEKRPVMLFWGPHGGLGDPRQTNMDYFAAIDARLTGEECFVDGFYEGVRRLQDLGVQVIKHDGTPGIDDRYRKCGKSAYDEQHALNKFCGGAIGLDAIAVQPQNGIDETTGDDYWRLGQGCLMEGVPDPTDETQAAWLVKPWPIVCTWQNAQPRIFSQAGWAVGKWPVAGTPEFDAAYGPERRIVLCMNLEAFGDVADFDAGWSNATAANRYVDAWKTGVRAILTQCPHAIVLLPKGLPELCARRGRTAAEFLP